MATKIRLARGGSKKRPYYRIVAADSRSPRDGKFLEKLGTYNPLLGKDNDSRVILNEERIKYWLGVGATPTEKVEKFLVAAKIIKLDKNRAALLKKRDEKSQEAKKLKLAEEAKKAAEEKAAAEADAAGAEGA